MQTQSRCHLASAEDLFFYIYIPDVLAAVQCAQRGDEKELVARKHFYLLKCCQFVSEQIAERPWKFIAVEEKSVRGAHNWKVKESYWEGALYAAVMHRGKEYEFAHSQHNIKRKEGAREWALGLQKHTLHNNCAKLEKFLWGLTTLWAADQKITIYYSLASAASAISFVGSWSSYAIYKVKPFIKYFLLYWNT